MLAKIRRTLKQHRAERRYFQISDACARPREILGQEFDPALRAAALEDYACSLAAMASLHRDAFGLTPLIEEGGRDAADVLMSESRVLYLLADVERALHDELPVEAVEEPHGPLEEAAAPVLGRMLAAPLFADRVALLNDLYDAVHPVIGGQAAETIACLPAPGRSIPHCGVTYPS